MGKSSQHQVKIDNDVYDLLTSCVKHEGLILGINSRARMATIAITYFLRNFVFKDDDSMKKAIIRSKKEKSRR